MKTIQPVMVWYNGQEVQATILSAVAQNDNLLNSCTFQYQLMNEVSSSTNVYTYTQALVTGYLNMTGAAYDAWETNEYAYEWIAEQLNLTITGPYVPPVPPVPHLTTTSTSTTIVSSTSTTTTTKKA